MNKSLDVAISVATITATPMTARTATRRLYVALVSLVTALVLLVAALVRLYVAGVSWIATRVEACSRPIVPQKPATAPARHLRLLPAAPATLPVTGSSEGAERLTTALTGLGFKSPQVRAFVTSLGGRVEHEPIADLIRAGLVALSRAA